MGRGYALARTTLARGSHQRRPRLAAFFGIAAVVLKTYLIHLARRRRTPWPKIVTFRRLALGKAPAICVGA